MKNRLRLVASNDERFKPQRFNCKQLLAYAKATPGAFAPFVVVPLRLFRYLLYMVMLFMRIPVQIVCRLTIVPLLLFAGIWGLLKGWNSEPTMLMVSAAFALFIFSALYDMVLMLVAPERIYLDT